MQKSRNTYTHICTQGIILQPATVYLRSFKELYLFNFKEMIYLLTERKEINSFEAIMFFHGVIFISPGSFQGTYQFILRNISSFKENIFILGHYIHSRIYINLRNIYLFKFKAISSFRETIFIEHSCVRGHSRNINSKIVPSHFMIIINFTITIS